MLGLGPRWGALPTSWCQDPELHCTFLGKDSTSASRKTLKNVNPSTSLLPYNPDSSHDTGDRPLAWAPGPTCPAPGCLQHHPSLCPEPAPTRETPSNCPVLLTVEHSVPGSGLPSND